MRCRCLTSVAVAGVLVGCWAGLGAAATRTWNGKTDTDWFTSGNWDPIGSPATGDVLNVWSAPSGNLPVASGLGAAVHTGGGTGRISVKNPTISATFLEGLYVGWDGQGELLIEDGGTVTASTFLAGNSSGHVGGGLVTVREENSMLDCFTNIHIGNDGAGAAQAGSLLVERGGQVSSGTGYIGYGLSSTGNVATVTGSGSIWDTNGAHLNVGYRGSGSLNITAGGTVSSQTGYIGYWASSTGNVATVTGSGSTWDTNGGTLRVGSSGSGTLTIEDGGRVSSGLASVGCVAGSTGNTVTVAGRGSTWETNGGSLCVGQDGSGEITIEGGGLLSTGIAFIGHGSSSSGNVATVSGSGSAWDTDGNKFHVGYNGSGTLTVEAGAAVTSGVAYLGYGPLSSGNVATVTGAGSTWDTTGHSLYVGYEGSGTLDITDGAGVSSGTGYIGRKASSSGNRVHLAGAGSTWDTNGDPLYVGGLLGSGELEVRTGATVNSGTGYIGMSSAGTAEVATGGTWNCILLYVGLGSTGAGTLTIRDNGSVVTSATLHIGPASQINLDGGLLSVWGLGNLEGALNFISGTLQVTGHDVTFAAGEPLGPTMTLGMGQALVVDRDVIIDPAGRLTADGGEVRGETLRNDGSLIVRNGGEVSTSSGLTNTATMTVSSGTVAGPGKLTNEMGGELSASGLIDADLDNYGDLTLNGALRLTDTTSNFGRIGILAGRTLRLDGWLDNFGLIDLDGGGIIGSGWMTNEPEGVIRGGSGIGPALTNAGLIHADADSTLLITDLSGGNLGSGELRIDDGAGIHVMSAFSNAGLIRLQGPGASLLGGSIANTGTIAGEGRITNPIANSGHLRAVENGLLVLSDAGLTNTPGGVLEVLSGGALLATQGLADNQGTIVLRGGTFDNSTHPTTNSGYILGSGTLRAGGLTNDGHIGAGAGDMDVITPVVNDGTISVAGGSTIVFYNDVSGNGVDGNGSVLFLAGYSPGKSPAVVGFGGDVAFGPAASLNVELANEDNSDLLDPRYDALDIDGDVDLAGTLSVDWLPIDGDPNSKFGGAYSILAFGGSRSGVFDGVDCQMAAYLDTSVFDDGVEYDDANGEVKIHLHDLLDGDADLDGKVAREDFHALQVGFGSPEADWFGGDFNFDGRVDFLDYLTWKANVGDAVGGGEKIPEPATLSLLALGGLGVLKRKRRPRR